MEKKEDSMPEWLLLLPSHLEGLHGQSEEEEAGVIKAILVHSVCRKLLQDACGQLREAAL
eukprot:1158743-Pelagomonas_calceolata.AAC.13